MLCWFWQLGKISGSFIILSYLIDPGGNASTLLYHGVMGSFYRFIWKMVSLAELPPLGITLEWGLNSVPFDLQMTVIDSTIDDTTLAQSTSFWLEHSVFCDSFKVLLNHWTMIKSTSVAAFSSRLDWLLLICNTWKMTKVLAVHGQRESWWNVRGCFIS